MIFIFMTALLFASRFSPQQRYIQWVQQLEVTEHPEENYRFYSEIHHQIAKKVQDNPGVITPFKIGRTVEQRSIWGFRISNPIKHSTDPERPTILIFAGLHPLEWVAVESTVDALLNLVDHPPKGVDITVVPIVNVDRRLVVEYDLRRGERKYRRVNSGGEDLNREFKAHRHEKTVWRQIFTERYETSSSPLSQPESKALDRLAQENFDAAVSLHCFGGYIYYPWAGIRKRPQDWRELHERALIMKMAQPGPHSYRVKQLSHWMLPFRPQGTELDHFYQLYGTHSYLIEMTRSGIQLFNRSTWKDPFRMYNPVNPQLDIARGRESIMALILSYEFSG